MINGRPCLLMFRSFLFPLPSAKANGKKENWAKARARVAVPFRLSYSVPFVPLFPS
jgi:hypothetical protein